MTNFGFGTGTRPGTSSESFVPEPNALFLFIGCLFCLLVSRLNKPLVVVSILTPILCFASCWPAAADPGWQNTGGDFPETTTQVRSMIVRQGQLDVGQLYVGLSGVVGRSAQIWKLAESGWVKHLEFQPWKVAVLETDDQGRLFVGMGTPHSAEDGGPGEAEFRAYDANDRLVTQKKFENMDVIYSMAWYQDKLHLGTFAEDIPGSAEIWRYDEPGWTQIAGPGILNWPTGNTYAGLYEMHVHNGQLYAGTFSRVKGDGDVLKLTPEGWTNINAPESIIAIAFITYRDMLVAAFSNFHGNLANPIFYLDEDGAWQPLGEAPAEWKDAHIHNHFTVMGDDLYVGVGGQAGTLSVWKFDGTTWSKVAGDGVFGSWHDPLAEESSHEWVYRMIVHQGKLYVGLAGDVSSLGQVWKMTP